MGDLEAFEFEVERNEAANHRVVVDHEDPPSRARRPVRFAHESDSSAPGALLPSAVLSPRSSGDRAPPSGGGGAGSNPAGGTAKPQVTDLPAASSPTSVRGQSANSPQ